MPATAAIEATLQPSARRWITSNRPCRVVRAFSWTSIQTLRAGLRAWQPQPSNSDPDRQPPEQRQLGHSVRRLAEDAFPDPEQLRAQEERAQERPLALHQLRCCGPVE